MMNKMIRQKFTHISEELLLKMYSSWYNMKKRCTYPGHGGYNYCGAKGITYDTNWNSFENFINDMYDNSLTMDKTLDRIDPKGNYSKANCRWATTKQQARNKTNNIKVLYKGKQEVLIELCETYNVLDHYKVVVQRIFRDKWDVEDALTRSFKRGNK